ncbi:MAG: hypothetical protein ACK56F_16450, partial [bacterium]
MGFKIHVIGGFLIYSMGKNNKGQLGIGERSLNQSSSPV